MCLRSLQTTDRQPRENFKMKAIEQKINRILEEEMRTFAFCEPNLCSSQLHRERNSILKIAAFYSQLWLSVNERSTSYTNLN